MERKIKAANKKIGLVMIIACLLPMKNFAYPTALCDGLLALVDRPTAASSPCTIPAKQVDLELGFQAAQLIPSGHGEQFPGAEFRVGLPANNEFHTNLPNYNHRSKPHAAGLSETLISYKQIVQYTDHWIFTVEGSLVPPSGSREFGSQGLGGIFNPIFMFELNSKLSITTQLGLSTETESELDGGKRFNSFNPVFVLSWSVNDKLQLYGTAYGKTKTASDAGSGFLAGGGLVYLVRKNLTLDIEGGRRIGGVLSNIENFVGFGAALLL